MTASPEQKSAVVLAFGTAALLALLSWILDSKGSPSP